MTGRWLGRYGIALAAWLGVGILPPYATGLAIVAATAIICEGSLDCSWGFELLLVVPVLIACLLHFGPRAVGRALGRRHEAAGARARKIVSWWGIGSTLGLYLAASGGTKVFTLAAVVVALGAPAAAATATRSTDLLGDGTPDERR